MTTHSLSELAHQVGTALHRKHLTLAVAESCTGGGLGYWITSVPDSSKWFDRGFITYSNEAKIELLRVHENTIDRFGAVSEQVAWEMAEGVLKISPANVSIAITGIAGPTGGSKEKPVGTVCIAWAKRDTTPVAITHHFSGDRHHIREESIKKALAGLMEYIA